MRQFSMITILLGWSVFLAMGCQNTREGDRQPSRWALPSEPTGFRQSLTFPYHSEGKPHAPIQVETRAEKGGGSKWTLTLCVTPVLNLRKLRIGFAVPTDTASFDVSRSWEMEDVPAHRMQCHEIEVKKPMAGLTLGVVTVILSESQKYHETYAFPLPHVLDAQKKSPFSIQGKGRLKEPIVEFRVP